MIDEYKQELLDLALAASPGVHTTLVETYGISDFSNMRGGELDMFHMAAMSLIHDDVNAMGMEFAEPINPLENYERMRTLCLLRNLFDRHNLSDRLQASSAILDAFTVVLDNVGDNQDLVLTNLIESCYGLFTLSEDWGFLNQYRFDLVSTPQFILHLNGVIEHSQLVDAEVSRSVFVAKIAKHVSQVLSVLDIIGGEDMVALKTMAFKYDLGLTSIPSDTLEFYGIDNVPILQRDGGVADTYEVTLHKSTSDHHFEYYSANAIYTPSDIQLKLLVAEYCDVGMGYAEVVAYTLPLMQLVKFDAGTIENFKGLARTYYNQN